MKSFRDLRVWRESVELAVSVYAASEHFPRREQYGLAAQMRKAAISIPSNIAEGQGRFAIRSWRQFLLVARGSLFELQTQLVIAGRLRFLDEPTLARLETAAADVGRALAGLIRHVDRVTEHHEQRTTNNEQR